MTYSRVHGQSSFGEKEIPFASPAFFSASDEQLLYWNRPLHGARPFSRIFPYDEYRSRRILEVGCGLGAMTSLWATFGAVVTSVDLNGTAVDATKRRLRLSGYPERVLQADARDLPFENDSFDYVFSWGVLHHSPDLIQSVSEIFRVLTPGGGFGLMLYNRRSILHWYMTCYLEGFVHNESSFLGVRELASRYGDGSRQEGNPYTWPVSKSELLELITPLADKVQIRVLGTDLDSVLTMAAPGLGLVLPTWARKPLARRWGWSLWVSGVKN